MSRFFLNPCPFCGGSADLDVYAPRDGVLSPSILVYCIRCEDCGASTEGIEQGRFDPSPAAEVVKKWNKRTGANS